MKHKIIVTSINGRIAHIAASGETQIILIEKKVGLETISILEPDLEFETGKAYELFEGDTKNFLLKNRI